MTGVLRAVSVAQSWQGDRPGGLNRYAADLHACLPAHGVDNTLVVFGPAQGSPAGVLTAGSEDAGMVSRLARMTQTAMTAGIDADLMATHFSLYGLLPALAPRLRRLPRIAHFHGPWALEAVAGSPGRRPSRTKNATERFHLAGADLVITASHAFADLVAARHGILASRVEAIHPGVDLERFTAPDEASRHVLRRRLGVPDEEFVVVTARRLVPRMGLEPLLQAWPGSANTRLVIIGEGPLRSGLERESAGRNGIVLAGRLSDRDLVDWYRVADLVVVPSLALEGFGLIVLEALACGTPVAVNDVGGLGEVLRGLSPELVLRVGDAAWAGLLRGATAKDLPSRAECRAFAERHGLSDFAGRVAELYRGIGGT